MGPRYSGIWLWYGLRYTRRKEEAKETYIRAFYEREAKFHIEFERIHPFEDGNGRTGRIITNAHLLHNNFAPIIITSSMKKFI